jgi:hypothetical protein
MTLRLGKCHLCGKLDRVLTYEHVPAQSSFNSEAVETFGLEHWLSRDADGSMKDGELQPRGAGAFTLCDPCNSRLTGSLYVPELKEWTTRGFGLFKDVIKAGAGANLVEAVFRQVHPAAFLKQVIAMLASINSADFMDHHPALREFVLNPDALGLPSRYQFYLAVTAPGTTLARNGGLSARFIEGSWNAVWVTDLVWPPFAYVMTIDEPAPYLAAGNITDFANRRRTDKVDVNLTLPILVVDQPYPGEFSDPANIATASTPFPTRDSTRVPLQIKLADGEMRTGQVTIPTPVSRWRGDDLWDLVSDAMRLTAVQAGDKYTLTARWTAIDAVVEIESAGRVAVLAPGAVPLVAIEEFTGHVPAPLSGTCSSTHTLEGKLSEPQAR